MKNIFSWILKSSADPSKVSRTVKTVLLFLAPLAMQYLGLTDDQWVDVVNSISEITISAFTLLFLLLKVYNTVRGTKY